MAAGSPCGCGARSATPTCSTPTSAAPAATPTSKRRRDERSEPPLPDRRRRRVEAHVLRLPRARVAGVEAGPPPGATGAPVPGHHHHHLDAEHDVVAAGNHRHRRRPRRLGRGPARVVVPVALVVPSLRRESGPVLSPPPAAAGELGGADLLARPRPGDSRAAGPASGPQAGGPETASSN